MRIIGLIPARGGSKGLKRKNLVSLAGEPLISWSIKAADSSGVTDVIVSSEDDEILKIASELGANVINRPAYLAQDDSTMDSVISHALSSYGVTSNEVVCLLQPTSPFRTPKSIDLSIDLLLEKNTGTVVGCSIPNNHPAKALSINKDGSMVGFISEEAPFLRRQDLPELFQPNGAIYTFFTKEFLKREAIPKKPLWPLLLNQKESIDIDTASDLKLANFFIG